MDAPRQTRDPALLRLVDQVRTASEAGTALEIRGGSTKRFYGSTPHGEPLDTCALAGISSYEPTELVVTARAGTLLAELEATLATHGQWLAFEPPRFESGSTIGGAVAAGLSGPSRAGVGALRDFVLGVTLLNGRGEVLTFGGQVMKNVAGYDVARLMAGSLGVLAVICEVSLKVLPLPPARTTLALDVDEGQALNRLAGWASKPLPINASAWHAGRLYLRLAGAAAAVRAARAAIGGEELAPDTAHEGWSAVRDHRHPFFVLDPADLGRGECLWRLSVPSTAPALGLAGESFIEWGGAQRWLRTAAAASQVRAAAARVGGHAVLLRGADKSQGVFAPLPEPLMRIHRGLKRSFDPAGIFNPGRMYPGL
ncbi:MAG: Glycolate dehydrogenase, FAD-binding subunit GlcE [Burkholderiaceae bacterium]|jgi:FAD/FMN-containing dehydrogenase|nr:MAG: Glycolate dehydrogenase, FAD-binding subunit GlcE [Burkholderiaceae bacterium]